MWPCAYHEAPERPIVFANNQRSADETALARADSATACFSGGVQPFRRASVRPSAGMSSFRPCATAAPGSGRRQPTWPPAASDLPNLVSCVNPRRTADQMAEGPSLQTVRGRTGGAPLAARAISALVVTPKAQRPGQSRLLRLTRPMSHRRMVPPPQAPDEEKKKKKKSARAATKERLFWPDPVWSEVISPEDQGRLRREAADAPSAPRCIAAA